MLAFLILAAAAVQTPSTPATVFSGLTGSCWQADVGSGNTDTHCFSESSGGQLVLDIHKVRDGQQTVVYEGVTAYRGDAGKVTFGYYNSLGSLMPGTVGRSGDDISASLTLPNGALQDVHWHLGGDGYDVTGPFPAPVHYRKIGPVGDSGL
ncbi:MAG: hypothetical protein JF571_07140 [Asticcacaulis sp.]|nr:hypothetical protein [Asticcacaulis sp.]